MPDIFAGFDILGLGTLLGSILFLGALVWLLVDNRSFDEVNRRHAAEAERKLPIPAAHAATVDSAPTRAMAGGVEVRVRSPRMADADARSGRSPDRPPHPRRVA